MRKLAFLMVVVVVGLSLSLPTAARADFALTYPDGVAGFALNFGPGLNVVALINDFGDIYTMHSDGFSNPVLVSLAGLPASRAMWLFFIGVTPEGPSEYELWIDEGSGFFFVDFVLL